MIKKQTQAKKIWIKPEVKVAELTMRALLGENGWYSPSNRILARVT
jgi:hypothetical protein